MHITCPDGHAFTASYAYNLRLSSHDAVHRSFTVMCKQKCTQYSNSTQRKSVVIYRYITQSFELMCTEHPHTTLTTVNCITLLLQLLWQCARHVVCVRIHSTACNMQHAILYALINLSFLCTSSNIAACSECFESVTCSTVTCMLTVTSSNSYYSMPLSLSHDIDSNLLPIGTSVSYSPYDIRRAIRFLSAGCVSYCAARSLFVCIKHSKVLD
jgi:hypothetical protein